MASSKDIDLAEKAVKGVLIIGGMALLVKLLSNAAKDAAQDKLFLEIGKSDYGQQAILLNQALNPSGANWMRAFDGTSLDTLYKVAETIKDFALVQKAYGTATRGRSLVEDLQDELTSSEFEKFMGIIRAGATNRIMQAIDPVKQFLYEVDSVARAKDLNTPLFTFPATTAGVVAFTRQYKADLGKILKRVNTFEGNWYMLNLGGKKLFIREEHLL